LKILYVAGREAGYSRTRIVLKALQRQGVEVIGCFPPDRSFKHYPALLWRTFITAPRCDLVLVGFYGQIILPVIRLLTWKPILFDMYITTYDTMVYDRAKARAGSWKARLYGFSDWLSYIMANHSVLETQSHINFFCRVFKVSGKKLSRIFLAVDDEAIYPRAQKKTSEKFLVHFHGEYAPFHGIPYILKAAKLLENESIRFQIIGRGITYAADQHLAQELQLRNVDFYDVVPYETLADMMANADLCLGIFGDNDRVLRVTTNKVVEALAMARPLLTAANEPVQELVTHEQSAYLIERANARALADAILKLHQDPALLARMAQNGYQLFLHHCTIQELGKQFVRIMEGMITK
jgi:glycosyltransferase involved in cell wall biosynthesis